MATNRTHLAQVNSDQQMSAGTKKHLAGIPSLSVAGTDMTPAQIAQMFDDRAASTQAVQAATAERTTAVKANRDKREQTAPAVTAFTSIVQGMFSSSPNTLAEFGLTPRKVAQKGTATKRVAALKSLATRKARHTMGKDQKAGIKGTVPAADIAIIQGSSSSASSPETTTPPTNVTSPSSGGGASSAGGATALK
jgi:hypothetical protein